MGWEPILSENLVTSFMEDSLYLSTESMAAVKHTPRTNVVVLQRLHCKETQSLIF